jgi:uncharacterized protein HemY
MELHLSPETEAWISQTASLRGVKPEELIEGLISDAAEDMVRETLDRRYDDMISGKVKMLSPEEAEAQFQKRRTEWLKARS